MAGRTAAAGVRLSGAGSRLRFHRSASAPLDGQGLLLRPRRPVGHLYGPSAARLPDKAGVVHCAGLPIGFVQAPQAVRGVAGFAAGGGDQGSGGDDHRPHTGAGGFGKTTLAAAFCQDEEINQAFDDGILWTTLGETPDLADAQPQPLLPQGNHLSC